MVVVDADVLVVTRLDTVYDEVGESVYQWISMSFVMLFRNEWNIQWADARPVAPTRVRRESFMFAKRKWQVKNQRIDWMMLLFGRDDGTAYKHFGFGS